MAVIAVTAIVGCLTAALVDRYNRAADLSETVAIRELIINAVKELQTPAPIDAPTGNIYFPEARLYLPAPAQPLNLFYTYAGGQPGQDPELSVTRSSALHASMSKLYQASDMQTMFAEVPRLQACSRGIRLVYDQTNYKDQRTYELRQTISLENGKTLYMFVEKSCTQLNTLFDALKTVRSY